MTHHQAADHHLQTRATRERGAPPSERGVKLPDVNPFATPPPANPLASPQHWSHTRRPANEAEARELAAWTFRADRRAELALIVRERFPDLAGQIEANLQLYLPEYERQRRIALDAGRQIELQPPLSSDAELEAAAETVRAHAPAAARAAYDEGRAAFVAAVHEGRLPYAEWKAWHERVRDAYKLVGEWTAAKETLGFVAGWPVGGGLRPGALLVEIAAVTGGGFELAPLPDQVG